MADIIVDAFPGADANPFLSEDDRPQPNPEIVAILEVFLERARRGDLVWLGLAYVGADNISRSAFVDANSPQLLSAALGATNYLNTRFSRACDEGAEATELDDPDSFDDAS